MNDSTKAKKKFIGALVLAAVCLFTSLPAGAVEEITQDYPISEYRVLFLNSYHRGYYWSDRITAAAEAELKRSHLDMEVFFEYLDVRRYATSRSVEVYKKLFADKYRDVKFDVLMV